MSHDLMRPFMSPTAERKFLRRATAYVCSNIPIICINTGDPSVCSYCENMFVLGETLSKRAMMEDHELWPQNTVSSR